VEVPVYGKVQRSELSEKKSFSLIWIKLFSAWVSGFSKA